MRKINKVLIANRGEIAVRIIKSCRKMGITAGAVFAEDDRESLHVKLADEVVALGKGGLDKTYLNIEKLLGIARENQYDAIHPGYGFLSENPEFAVACKANDIIFIGPDAEVMEIMGDKIASKNLAENAQVAVLTPISGTIESLIQKAEKYDYPLLVKAAAGGGGKGMKVVRDPKGLKDALLSAAREAESYFGDERIFLEKYVQNPRHIEVQVLADHYGNAITLFERECTLQRRHQKVIEEAPSPTLTAAKRKEILAAALRIVKSSGYTNAGTVEFLVAPDGRFYFLEMNTRIQVEHPVTEMITGYDLVEEQINIAAGKELTIRQGDVKIKGHAIECRIYAEDPEKNFNPSPGKIHFYREPEVGNIRIDAAIDGPAVVSGNYDPMIAKLVSVGHDRNEAIKIMASALNGYHIHGVKTNIQFQRNLVASKAFRENQISTSFIENTLSGIQEEIQDLKKQMNGCLIAALTIFYDGEKKPNNIWEEIGFWRIYPQQTYVIDRVRKNVLLQKNLGNELLLSSEDTQQMRIKLLKKDDPFYSIQVSDKIYQAIVTRNDNKEYFISLGGFIYLVDKADNLATQSLIGTNDEHANQKNGLLVAPMPGKILEVNVKEGERVEKDQKLVVLEAMKMENLILAPFEGVVANLFVRVNDKVDEGNQLINLKRE